MNKLTTILDADDANKYHVSPAIIAPNAQPGCVTTTMPTPYSASYTHHRGDQEFPNHNVLVPRIPSDDAGGPLIPTN